MDFAKNFNDFNNVKLEKFSNEIVRSVDPYSRVSVYGNDIAIDNTKTDWNITTDLASGLSEATSQIYYLYLSEDGQTRYDTRKPYSRGDLRGEYHPYESWRCLGLAYNDSSDDIIISTSVGFNKNEKGLVKISDEKASSTQGGASVSGWNQRVLNTIRKIDGNFTSLGSNIFKLPRGRYKIKAKAPAYAVNNHKIVLFNNTKSEAVIIGSNGYNNTSSAGSSGHSFLEGEIVVTKDTEDFYIRHWTAVATGSFGLGIANTMGELEVYTKVFIERIGL